jgi:hypothetical protein
MRTKLLLTFASLVLGVVLVEGGIRIYYFYRYGELLSNAELLEREPGDHLRSMNAEDCSYVDGLFPHPYLAFVRHANPPCGSPTINKSGFYGPEFPLGPSGETFVILLTGGSVATQLGNLTENGLAEVLERDYDFEGQKVIVLNGALEAWHQPQQLINFILNVQGIDAVVTLDGYNEFFFPRHPALGNAQLSLPWKLSYQALTSDGTASRIRIAAGINQRVYEAVGDHWLLSRSKLFYLVGSRTRKLVADWARKQEGAPEKATTLDSLFGFPADWDHEKRLQFNEEVYRRSFLMVDAVADRLGVLNAHFLQPVPAIGKDLTPAETQVVGNVSYGRDYQAFVDRLMRLRDEGVPMFSLIDLYRDWKGPIYRDEIHQEAQSEGYRFMADAIARRVAEEWKVPRRRKDP